MEKDTTYVTEGMAMLIGVVLAFIAAMCLVLAARDKGILAAEAKSNVNVLTDSDIIAMGSGVHWEVTSEGYPSSQYDEAYFTFMNQGDMQWVMFWVLDGRIKAAKLCTAWQYPTTLNYITREVYEENLEKAKRRGDDYKPKFTLISEAPVAEFTYRGETIQFSEDQLQLLRRVLDGNIENDIAMTELEPLDYLTSDGWGVQLEQYIADYGLAPDEDGIYWAIGPQTIGFKLGTVEHDGEKYLQPTFYRNVSGYIDGEDTIREWTPKEIQCVPNYHYRYSVTLSGKTVYADADVLIGVIQCVQNSDHWGMGIGYYCRSPYPQPEIELFYRELYN